MLEPRCPTHPTYLGEDPPETHACADCWELYRMFHEDGR